MTQTQTRTQPVLSWHFEQNFDSVFSSPHISQTGQTEQTQIVRDPGKRLINANRASQLMLKPIKYEWAWKHYKTAIENFWTFGEINFSYDVADLKKLTRDDRALLERVVSYFAVQEILIQDEVAIGLYPHITNPEVRMYLLAQAQIEAIHAETYDGFIDLLRMDAQKAYYAYQDDPHVAAKTNWAHEHLDILTEQGFALNCHENVIKFLMSLSALSLVEGIHFLGSFAILLNFRRRNIIQGICEAVSFIRRDEDQHCRFAAELFRAILYENPAFHTDIPLLQQHVHSYCVECVDLEKAFLKDVLPIGTLGLPYVQLEKYIEFLADRRMASFSIGPIYNQSKNPFPWLSELSDLRMENNFFERTSTTNYRKGGLK